MVDEAEVNVLEQEEEEENAGELEGSTTETNVQESEVSNIDFNNLENLNVKELQEICRQNKLKIKGRKDELIERIKNFFSVDKL